MKYLNLKNILGLVLVIAVLIGAQYLFTPSEAEGAWYSSGGTWTARKAITIDHTKVPGNANLTDFPVLIDITDPSLQASAQSDGDDILFTSSDGSTKLSHEIEIYTTATGRLTAWVKIPTLDYDDNTIIYMYYGNAGASSQQNATGVWDSNYKAVYHLPDGSTLNTNDSTSNSVNLTNNNAVTATQGQVDGAGNFNDASTQYLQSNTVPVTGYPFTISVWFKTDDNTINQTLVSIGDIGSPNQYFDIRLSGAVAGDPVRFTFFGGGSAATAETSIGFTPNIWQYATIVAESATDRRVYLNAGNAGSNTTSASPTGWNNIGVGVSIHSGALDRYMSGQIDEVRVSNIGRSLDWIQTEYNNQSATSTFYNISGVEIPNKIVASTKIQSVTQGTQAGWFATGGVWNYRKRISVNPQKVASTTGSNITNFPMLVSVVDPNLKSTGNGGKVGQTDGGDIVFTSDNGTTKLSHEIETYTPTTGELVAWVKIPFLSSTSTTPIYMYFGDDDVTDQADATNVWSAYYTGVWHLKETPNTANADSSGSVSCTPTLMESGDQTAGKINGSLNFDGSAEYLTCGDSLDFNLADSRTVSLWMNTDAIGGAGSDIGLLTKMNSAFTNGWGLFMGGTSPVLRFIYANSGNETRVDSTASLITVNSGWQHVVATYSNESVAFYIDGVNVGTSAASSGANGNVNNTISLNIASYADGDEQFDGQMDEVRFATSVLPADWVLTEYRNQSDPSSFYGYGGLETYGGRVNSSNSAVPAVKLRGGVKFR